MDSRAKYIIKKPKLPRKRKKAAIKAQGRDWYKRTIQLYYITQEQRLFYEPVCRFWVNASVRDKIVEQRGRIISVPVPTRYW